MALFFRKKDYVSQEDFRDLQERLRRAFSKIKTNFSEVENWATRSNEVDHKIELINSQLADLRNQMNLIQGNLLRPQDPDSNQTEDSTEEEIDYFQELSPTQLALLGSIFKVLKITKEGWVSVKTISKEYYPGREYQNIKSLLSEYTDLLLSFNLIKKQRRGRLMHVSLTEKGKKFCKEHSKELIDLSKTNLEKDRP